ncbi:MAG: hypothetical protein LUB63_04645, partial [Oscillospiraceae bacterium]|nr:hypothetical protein [Oscillospiraceae bacterium]
MPETTKELDPTQSGSAPEQLPGGQPRLTPEEAAEAGKRLNAIADNVETVIIGKRQAVELVITSLITGGHVLLEDVPGVGK